jgi:ABC-type bacteriocin/lantibiotic exporter with double-glycine peptidase domain
MRRLLAPEVIQTSAMDCGPACLKALLEGFGVAASYGRLREACFTGVDGTAIDQIEDTAILLGLNAEQIMLPLDHLLLDATQSLPALIVVRLPMGFTHFVVLWRKCGNWVQVMDPGTGRHWRSTEDLLSDIYIHAQNVTSAEWTDWAGSPNFLNPLEHRMRALGFDKKNRRDLITAATADPTPMTLSTLDAAVRFASALVAKGAIRRGASAVRFLQSTMKHPSGIPGEMWSARIDRADHNVVKVRGAVLLRVTGIRKTADADMDHSEVPHEFADVLTERAPSPIAALYRTLQCGATFCAVLSGALALAAFGVITEALLLRSLFELPHSLVVTTQRWSAIGGLSIFFAAVTALESGLSKAILQTGRRFEGMMRLRFLKKMPRLADAYFRSRLMSDMADRAHSAHRLRDLPQFVAALSRAVFGLLFTVVGIVWLYPSARIPAFAAAVIAVIVPAAALSWMTEKDLRARTHSGALSRFLLDALLGLTAVHAHGAARSITREHDNLLAEWATATRKLSTSVVAVQSLQSVLCGSAIVWLLIASLRPGAERGGILLLVYWALSIPALGQEITALGSQYPRLKNTMMRFIEPLGAREEGSEDATIRAAGSQFGVTIEMDHVSVSASRQTILEDINVRIGPREHVAVIGPSGAGKSTLAGLLLGWCKPERGELVVDGVKLHATALASLRRQTVWISPEVQLWNRPLFDNLRYGSTDSSASLGDVLEQAELSSVVEKLPLGLQTPLGESGRLLSGGEGQRARFGRALCRDSARLVILDEAFRGLERGRRRMLLESARRRWKDATLLNVTHDIGEAWSFPRVLVIDGGRIVEDGSPDELYQRKHSRFRALLEAEEAAQECVWSDPVWKTFAMRDGRLSEESRSTVLHRAETQAQK